jgi:hypothetical protein
LVARHPRASAFHQRGWLDALARTYGYEPFVLTSAAPDKPLTDGLVCCRVSSWITGTRLVSLPFADHCEPLLRDNGDLPKFMDELRVERDRQRYKYLELRPLFGAENPGYGLRVNRSYVFHELDITPSLEQLFAGLHKDSIQRRIRRAEKERLCYETGRSEELVDEFYRLLMITRRRHQLPPQPRSWFKNLVQCMGDNVEIRLARKDSIPIGAILTLQHRSSIIYKYGCSDGKFHNLGGMPFLFWRLIQESKALGIERIDFGRSDLDNAGLIAFKDKFGTTRRSLAYYRYPESPSQGGATRWNARAMKQLFSMLPDTILSSAGKLLYRHIG